MSIGLLPQDGGVSNLEGGMAWYETDKEDVDLYLTYIRGFRDFMNGCFVAEGIDAEIDISGVEARVGNMEDDPKFRSVVGNFAARERNKKKAAGKIFRGQMATAVAAIACALLDGFRHVAILGSTQSGKSGTMDLLFAVEPLIYFQRTGQFAVPLICLVNKNDLFRQFVNGFKSFIDLHQYVAIKTSKPHRNARARVPLGAYYFQVFNKFGENVFEWDHTLHKNAAGADSIEKFKKLIEKARSLNMKVFCSMDEAHYGSEEGGVFWKMAYQYIASVDRDQYDVDFRAISATNWENSLNENFKCVAQRIEKGYCGSQWFMGHKLPCIDPDWTVKPPGVSKVADLVGQEMHVSKYEKVDAYEKREIAKARKALSGAKKTHNAGLIEQAKQDLEELFARTQAEWAEQWGFYRKTFRTGLRKIISKTLMKGGQKGEGLVIRCARRNTTARDLCDKLEKWLIKVGLDNDVVIIPYYGKHCMNTVEQTIEEHNPGGKKYIMVVTGGARMGVEFPAHSRFFVDLTHEPSTSTAEVQGLFGRATGYWKQSEVWVSDDSYASIVHYLTHKGHPRKRPHMRVRGTGAAKPCNTVNFHKLRIREMADCTDKKLLLGLLGQMEGVIESQRGARWLQGDASNSRRLWPLVDTFIDLSEKHPELAQFGNEGSFGSTPLVRRPPHGKEDKYLGKQTKFTDAAGRIMSNKIARRNRYLDKQMTDRGRTNGGRERLPGGRFRKFCEVQVYFNLDVDSKHKDEAKEVDIQYINVPLRVPQQKIANYEMTDRSAWHRDNIAAALAMLSAELAKKEAKAREAAAKTVKFDGAA